MNDYSRINSILCEKTDVDKNKIINASYSVKDLSLMKVRDMLIRIGNIEHEYLSENIYFAIIPGGILKKNIVYMVVELKGDNLNIAVFSNEGLFKQHTSEVAINEIEKCFKEYICNG